MRYNKGIEYWVDLKTGLPRFDFEDMYKDIADPWGCSEGVDSLPNRIFLEMIFHPDTVYENILDIGCGLGALLASYKLKDNYAELHGTELSNLAGKHASKFAKIFIGNLEAAKYESEYFDAVTCHHVIEHVPEP